MNSRPKDPRTARNKNVLVIGGSGSGKTRYLLKPNLMQCHSSYVITDPKGSLLIECGHLLEKKKYPIARRSLLNFSGAVVKLKGESTRPNENENTTFMTLLESNPSSMEEITSFFIGNIQTIAQQQKDKLNNRQETNSQAIADYIDANFRNPQLSTKHLSSEFNLSEAYLARIFKKALGISVQGYINKVRVEEAKRVLADPKMKIKDITEMIGIQNRQYFFKLFKNLTGKTPNEYQVDLEILRSEPHK